MRRIFSILFVACVCLIAMISCSEKIVDPEEVTGDVMSFTAVIESTPGTRATMEDGKAVFVVGDKVQVNSSDGGFCMFACTEIGEEGTAVFTQIAFDYESIHFKASEWCYSRIPNSDEMETNRIIFEAGTPAEGSTFYALFGDCYTSKAIDDKKIEIYPDFPVIELGADKLDSPMMVAYLGDTVDNSEASFRNVCALIKVAVPAGVKVYGFAIKDLDPNGEMYGSYQVNVEDGTIERGIPLQMYDWHISYAVADYDTSMDHVFYLPVFPHVFANGVSIGFTTDEDAGDYVYEFSAGELDEELECYHWRTQKGSVSFQRSKVYDIGTVTTSAPWFR